MIWLHHRISNLLWNMYFLLHRFSALSGSVDVPQSPRSGGWSHQAGHVPEVWTQEALVCQGELPVWSQSSWSNCFRWILSIRCQLWMTTISSYGKGDYTSMSFLCFQNWIQNFSVAAGGKDPCVLLSHFRQIMLELFIFPLFFICSWRRK